jgi:hypothetical protein
LRKKFKLLAGVLVFTLFLGVSAYLYNEGAPIGYSATKFMSDGQEIAIPREDIHIAWTPVYLFEMQYRAGINTFFSFFYNPLFSILFGYGIRLLSKFIIEWYRQTDPPTFNGGMYRFFLSDFSFLFSKLQFLRQPNK